MVNEDEKDDGHGHSHGDGDGEEQHGHSHGDGDKKEHGHGHSHDNNGGKEKHRHDQRVSSVGFAVDGEIEGEDLDEWWRMLMAKNSKKMCVLDPPLPFACSFVASYSG